MVYKCTICGYVYDEEKEGRPFSELTECPVCKQPPEKFEAAEPLAGPAGLHESEKAPSPVNTEALDLNYPTETRKTDGSYRYMKEIHEENLSLRRWAHRWKCPTGMISLCLEHN